MGVAQNLDKDELMSRYLLGDLSEAEQTTLEDEYFADDEIFGQMLAVEDDLIDAYVHGELPAAEREQFERRFLTTPQRRARVEFARCLLRDTAVVTASPAAGQARGSWWQSLLGVLRAQTPAAQFAFTAAALVLALGGSWLLVGLRQRSALEQAGGVAQQQSEQAPQPQVAAQRAPSEQLTEKSPDGRTEAARSEQALAQRQSRPDSPAANRGARPRELAKQPSRPSIASFVLTPGLVRGSGESHNLNIAPGTGLVRLQLILAEDDYQSYRAALQTAEGDEVWRRGALKAQPTKSGRAVVLRLPSSLLSRRDYILLLRGVSAAGTVEDVGDYAFRVVKK